MKKKASKAIPPASDGLEVHKKIVLEYLDDIAIHVITNLIVARNAVSSNDVRYMFHFNIGWMSYDVEVFNNEDFCEVVAYTFFGECVLDFKVSIKPQTSSALWEIARRTYNNDHHWVNDISDKK